MFDYKPERSSETLSYDEIGSLGSDFEPFKLDPKYGWQKRGTPPDKNAWKIVVPKTGPRIGELSKIIQDLIKTTWRFAEPKAGAQRGNVMMGMRNGAPNGVQNQTYNPQVRPVKAVLPTTAPSDAAIAADWKVFEQIKRTNAVTFRGDSRPPVEVILNKGGFTPPNSRTDDYYLENNIYNAFSDYLTRRYQRPLAKDDFLRAVATSAPTAIDKKILVDYLMWRKITEKEAIHLGRMVENECLKGYISTSRAIDSAGNFATRFNSVPGWIYITVVHGGFIVPWGKTGYWGTEEAEIAQWGAIPSARIVGFVGTTQWGVPRTAVYVRRSFRKTEPEAFEKMFKAISGKRP